MSGLRTRPWTEMGGAILCYSIFVVSNGYSLPKAHCVQALSSTIAFPQTQRSSNMPLFCRWRNRPGEDRKLARWFLLLGRRFIRRGDKAPIPPEMSNCLPHCWWWLFTSGCHFLHRSLWTVLPQGCLSSCYTLWSQKPHIWADLSPLQVIHIYCPDLQSQWVYYC